MDQNQIQEIEKNIKKLWKNSYKTEISEKPSYCILDFFPYPSGIGLHIGHTIGYIATDIFARFKRMEGYNVLYAMGFDSFGLPAEQFAIQTNQHPEITTKNNINNMKSQLEALSLSHDPDRSFSTTDEDYYKWTQWIFLKLYNSYFNNLSQKAEPISDLRKKLESGKFSIEDSQICERENNYTKTQIDNLIKEMRLAYLDEVEVNWCPMLGTVLSNEEVQDGKSEQGNHPVEKKPMKQWIFRITAYGDRLHNQLDKLNWPENIVTMQKNWIGKQEGVKISFQTKQNNKISHGKFENSKMENSKILPENIDIFTTRPETIFGVAFIAVSHDHQLAKNDKFDQDFSKNSFSNSSENENSNPPERLVGHAIHPLTNEEIPIWTADYVLSEYGTGAVMSVPAHDQRDFEFAKRHAIKFKSVIKAPYNWLEENCEEEIPNSQLLDLWKNNPEKFNTAFENKAPLFYPSDFEIHENISVKNQIKQAIEFIEKKKAGKKITNYRLRDWLFSRQRYWGEPFPIVFDEGGNAYPVHESCLPVTLPKQYDFKPVVNQQNAEPPLTKAEEWKFVYGIITEDGNVKTLEKEFEEFKTELENNEKSNSTQNIEQYNNEKAIKISNKIKEKILEKYPNAQLFKRELNTMPNWAGSCWYYLRYMDPRNNQEFLSKEAMKYWSCDGIGAIDKYVGGAEHAVLHLLYARFWHMVLFDLGYVNNPEPFNELVNPGMMTADAYSDSRGFYVDVEDVEIKNDQALQISTGNQLNIEPGKMGKRYKNGIDPRKACDMYGIDILRLHVMYMAPITQSRSWSTRNIKGMERFYRSIESKISNCIENPAKTSDQAILHKTIKFVTDEMKEMRYNTAIAALIKLNNNVEHFSLEDSIKFLQMLYPFTPHLSEYLYQKMKNEKNSLLSKCEIIITDFIEEIEWPKYNESLTKESIIKLPVNVNGKLRGVLEIKQDISDDEIKELVQQNEKINKHIISEIKKYMIIRKDKPIIVNIII